MHVPARIWIKVYLLPKPVLFDLHWSAFQTQRQTERERELEYQRLMEKKLSISTGHVFWPRTSKEPGAGWNWRGLGREHLSHCSLASLSPGQVGAGLVGTDPRTAYQGWRGALSWKPWLLPSAQGRLSLPKLAGGSLWNGNSPHPPRLGMIFWQAYVVKSYRWCRHGLEEVPAGPPPRSLLITHQITRACLQNPRNLHCSRKPASRAAKASEKLE